EALPDFLAAADRDIAKEAQRAFKKQKLDIRLGAKVTGSEAGKKGVKVSYEDKDGKQSIDVDKLVVAVGRRAFTEGLDPEAAGLRVDNRGRIEVDGHCRTGVDGIWAIGDV
ncbi:MAG: FAD-dependent oxidoreductase, partial [Gammaproteobacteria bacterium]|nr:FAD-dependent oxidoreductase [Gammaproteobacteria bacterium]NIQ28496.1 FAD-dependent oxidoreductase [Gammaproteobacteria bacterium]